MTSIRAVILDLDGLMLDSEPDSYRAWQEVLSGLGASLPERVYQAMIGLAPQAAAEHVLRHTRAPIAVPDLIERQWSIRTRLAEHSVSMQPGLPELLSVLDSRRLPVAVASNSLRDYVVAALRTAGLTDRFAGVITSDQVERGKPAPDIYLQAARVLAVPPGYCLAFEDSRFGLQAALAAGMRCVVAANCQSGSGDWPGAAAVYPSLREAAVDLDRLLE
jgi:beta-phosphoglucomutase